MEKRIKKLLKQLVSIPSDYPNEVGLSSFITSLFLKEGYDVLVQKVEGERNNIIVTKGNGEKTIVLYAHLDTVPKVDGWKTNPFNPKETGGKIVGLGAYDMKGGVAVNIETFLNYEPKNIRMMLLFCVDEENISKGGYVFAKSKQAKHIACVLSPEPAFAHGLQGVVTGRIGRAVIEISITYPQQHFYFYHPKNDIHLFAAELILKLKSIFVEKKGKKEFMFVRSMHSQSRGMSTPSDISLELDMSILPPHTPTDMLRQINDCIRDVSLRYGNRFSTVAGFKKRETPFLSGYEIPHANRYITCIDKAIFDVTKKHAVPYFRSSVADENIFGSRGIPVLGVGPEGGNAHSAQEWVSVSSLTKLHHIYLEFLRQVDK